MTTDKVRAMTNDKRVEELALKTCATLLDRGLEVVCPVRKIKSFPCPAECPITLSLHIYGQSCRENAIRECAEVVENGYGDKSNIARAIRSMLTPSTLTPAKAESNGNSKEPQPAVVKSCGNCGRPNWQDNEPRKLGICNYYDTDGVKAIDDTVVYSSGIGSTPCWSWQPATPEERE